MNRATKSLQIVLCVFVSVMVQAQGPGTTRVLFIGNSYTYFNDLPDMFARFAEAGHQGKVETQMVAPGGSRLKDHWEKGAAQEALESQKWDFVVLQDHSRLGMDLWVDGTRHANSDVIFRPYAEKWVAAIRAKGATPVFFLTWAGLNAPEDQPILNYAYAHVAKDTGSLLAPVGIAWDALRREQPSIALFYEGHGSHPSPAGSYLAACVLYATIFRQSPLGLPSKLIGTPVNLDTEKLETDKSATLVDLSAKDAETVQQEAWNTVQRITNHGGYPDVSLPRPPSAEPLPAGLPLSESDIEGTWRGTILFYPPGPADLVLTVRSDTHGLRTHLEIKYHSKDFPDESIELSDFRILGSELSFSDPKSVGVDNAAVHLTGVMPRPGELRGTAEASRENVNSQVSLLGSWSLRKE